MRRIIFRGKRTDTGEWVFGDLHHREAAPKSISNVQVNGCGVIPKTVGQFTGLLDKNGKEIYEGDILSIIAYHNDGQGETFDFRDAFTVEELKGKLWYKYLSQVLYKEGGFWLSEASENDTSICVLFGDMRHSFPMFECEVIGCIHDNPELLKGGEE